MMFSAGSYAKIWEIKEEKGNYTDIRISTSKKDRETGDYKQDFGGFVRMVGKAHEAMAHLEERDSFKIVRCGVENHYDKDKKVTYNNFVIFEVETDDSYPENDGADEDNPFL